MHLHWNKRLTALLASLVVLAIAAGGEVARAAAGEAMVPIIDLGPGLYLGQFEGGLYPGGSNTIPAAHAAEGLARSDAITPRGTDGSPDPNGKIVVLSVGMSNTRSEFCGTGWLTENCLVGTFMGEAVQIPNINRADLYLVNGATAGQSADTWIDPNNASYQNITNYALGPRGLTDAQVQVIWMKVANAGPSVSLPSPSADAYTLLWEGGMILRAMHTRYPNLQMVFVSSRIYGGYAVTTLNPEPYAYEAGFAMKWLIEAQINQMQGGGIDPIAGDLDYNTVAPWVAWGPYLWADGANPRSDGLAWYPEDFLDDGTHPSAAGAYKVAVQLVDFFSASPFTTDWFFGEIPGSGSINGTIGLDANSDPSATTVTLLMWSSPVLTVIVRSDGTFSAILPAADYKVNADTASYLGRQTVEFTLPENAAITLPFAILTAGDVNDDNIIDHGDYALMQARYNTICGDPLYGTGYDLNADCKINIQDVSLAAANFGQTGPLPWPLSQPADNKVSIRHRLK